MANAYPTDEQPTELGSVFRVCSRFNHSCVPNAHIAWNARLRRMAVHALGDPPAPRVSYGFTGEGTRARSGKRCCAATLASCAHVRCARLGEAWPRAINASGAFECLQTSSCVRAALLLGRRR